MLEHHDLTYVVFMAHGEALVAQHVAMPFGTTSAVHAWHRTGTWLSNVLRRFFRVPVGKFVDDFFGVSAEGVRLGGGQCLDALGRLVGLPPKDIKSVSFARTMCILGAILSFVPEALALKLAGGPRQS